jgi:hypothetical protein
LALITAGAVTTYRQAELVKLVGMLVQAVNSSVRPFGLGGPARADLTLQTAMRSSLLDYMSPVSIALQQLVAKALADASFLPPARLKECLQVALAIARVHNKLDASAAAACWAPRMQEVDEAAAAANQERPPSFKTFLDALAQMGQPRKSKKRGRGQTEDEPGQAKKARKASD